MDTKNSLIETGTLVVCPRRKSLVVGFPLAWFCATYIDAHRNLIHSSILRSQPAWADDPRSQQKHVRCARIIAAIADRLGPNPDYGLDGQVQVLCLAFLFRCGDLKCCSSDQFLD